MNSVIRVYNYQYGFQNVIIRNLESFGILYFETHSLDFRIQNHESSIK